MEVLASSFEFEDHSRSFPFAHLPTQRDHESCEVREDDVFTGSCGEDGLQRATGLSFHQAHCSREFQLTQLGDCRFYLTAARWHNPQGATETESTECQDSTLDSSIRMKLPAHRQRSFGSGALAARWPTMRASRTFRESGQTVETAPSYSVLSFVEYSFSPFEVTWAEEGDFASSAVGTVAHKPIVLGHKVMVLPTDDEEEAHYVCAVASFSPFVPAVSAYTIAVQEDSHIYQNVRVPCFDPSNRTHRRLSELSEQAHAIASGEAMGLMGDVEREVDECAAEVWGLTAEELEAVRRSLRE